MARACQKRWNWPSVTHDQGTTANAEMDPNLIEVTNSLICGGSMVNFPRPEMQMATKERKAKNRRALPIYSN